MQQIAAVLQVFRLCGRMTFAADRPTRPFDPEARKLSAGFSLRRKKPLIATIRTCHEVEKLTNTGRISALGTQPTVDARLRGRNASSHHGATSAQIRQQPRVALLPNRPRLRANPASQPPALRRNPCFPIVRTLADPASLSSTPSRKPRFTIMTIA